jgi:hypothetical protein
MLIPAITIAEQQPLHVLAAESQVAIIPPHRE